MADVRILFWNIRFFAESVVKNQSHLTKIVNLVHPAVGGPAFDVFIIVEPNKFKKPTNVGQVLPAGSSMRAMQTLFYALYRRNVAWRLVPPRVLTCSSNKEVHAVYYYRTNVTLVGIEPPMNVPNPTAFGALTPAMIGFGIAVLPPVHAYGGVVDVGVVRHSPNANAATALNEVTFDTAGHRRPYRVRLRTTGGNPRSFDVYSHHAAPDSDYPSNANGIANMARVHAIGGGRALPVLICGDFNCCPMNPCPNKPGGHHNDEVTAQNSLTSQHATRYKYNKDAMASLKAAKAATDAAKAMIAGGPALPVQQAITALTTAAGRISADLGNPANITLAGLIGAAMLAGAAVTGIVGTAAQRARAAQNAAVAVTNDLGPKYSAPPLITHLATAVAQTMAARNAVGANILAAVKAVGAAVAAGLAVTPSAASTAAHQAATNAANAANTATNVTPNLATVAETARDRLFTLAERQYRTHIVQTLTSLKQAGSALPNDYRAHAFDHFLAHGFDDESDGALVDIIHADAGYAIAALSTNTFRALIRRYRQGAKGEKGISDHLPCKLTITLN